MIRIFWRGLVWSPFFLFFFMFGIASAINPPSVPITGDRQHIVYFEGTPHELEIYKIYGRQEGPTIMIMGGIQGDEPGGFLSADLYVDLALKRGNLIVVPRANFKSIIMSDRGPDGDMNRKFADIQELDPDKDNVEIIKNLMAESDLFLNLHDGSGFYRTEWESDMANPSRYGQCVIADAEVYTVPETGRVLHLGQEARKVVEMINRDIPDQQYKFSFSNHDTLSPKTSHAEQRKSASYYALTKMGIPAFGLETSKQLPSLEMKIHQHNLAVNAFMELYGVVPEQPRINMEPPALNYLVISVNNKLPVAVADGQTLLVTPGDMVEVVHVGANYDRGLTVDILGLGGLSDIRLPLKINKPTTIIARRDQVKFGEVKLGLLPQGAQSPQLEEDRTPRVVSAGAGYLPDSLPDSPKVTATTEKTPATGVVTGFKLEVDGQSLTLAPENKLTVRKGAKIKLVGLESASAIPQGTVMNLKGFVGRPGDTSGNDLGTTADTAIDMMSRFAINKTGSPVYQLGAEKGPSLLARAFIEVSAPQLQNVVLEVNGQEKVLKLAQRWSLPAGTKVTVKKIELADGLPLANPRYTLGGHPFPSALPQVLTMPNIAVSLAVFTGEELAGKVVLVPKN